MRRCFVVLFCLCLYFVSASVDVDSYYIGERYLFGDKISGEVNLTIEDVDSYEMISLSNGKSVFLIDFLEDNWAYFECFPEDCLGGYSSSSGDSGRVSVSLSGEEYVGFVLTGGEIVLDSISFDVCSDFGVGAELPLTIEFFEKEVWEFSSFSEDFLPKDWGCFSPSDKVVGARIGSFFYCEMIEIENTNAVRIGADVSGEGGDLDMVLYSEDGFGVGGCSFDPASEEGCEVNSDEGEFFSGGEYWVCVGSDGFDGLTPYNIYEDTVGENCGFPFVDGSGSSVRDYAIFAQGVKYAGAKELGGVSFSDKVEAANSVILERYGGRCDDGCFLPLKVEGVSQNFEICNVNLIYMDDSQGKSNEFVYELERIPSIIDFDGSLDLGLFGIDVFEDGEYFARLSGEYLFREDIELLPAPIIDRVWPLSLPAVVPITFYADVDFDDNRSLSYYWDFGDGNNSKITNVSSVSYSYESVGDYVLSLNVSVGSNLSSEKSFDVSVVSPESAVADELKIRKDALANVRRGIVGLSSWYKDDLIKILELVEFESEIARLEKEYNNSIYPEEFVGIIVEVYSLNVPFSLGFDDFESSFFMTELGDVDIGPVGVVSGLVDTENEDDYANAIILWQNENIDVVIKNKNVFVDYLNGDRRDVLSAYDFDVSSKWEGDSFFVINKPFGDLYFNEGGGTKKVDDATVITIDSLGSKSFEFYYKDASRGRFFVSPDLRSLVIEGDIRTDCDFDLICEEEMGETPDTCRSDCKPVSKAFFIFGLFFLFIVAVYTILHIWYKKNYEGYLFHDKSQLYNLLMYISNARARGVDDLKIVKDLKTRGWSGERIEYGIRKSLGKNIGMIEVVPIERVSAWIRDWKARQAVKLAIKTAERVQADMRKNAAKSK